MSRDLVWLNVGGTRFATSRATLGGWGPDTFFAALGRFEEGGEVFEEGGEVFVDRSPAVFAVVLQHLRGETAWADLRDLSPAQVRHVRRECDFYLLPALRALLDQAHWNFDPPPGCFFDGCDFVSESDDDLYLYGPVLFSPRLHVWTIETKNHTDGTGLSVGIESADADNPYHCRVGLFGGMLLNNTRVGQPYLKRIPSRLRLMLDLTQARFRVEMGPWISLPQTANRWRPMVKMMHRGDTFSKHE